MVAVDVEHDRTFSGVVTGVEGEVGEVLVAVFFATGVWGDGEARSGRSRNACGLVVGVLDVAEFFVSRVRTTHAPHQRGGFRGGEGAGSRPRACVESDFVAARLGEGRDVVGVRARVEPHGT